TLDGTLWIEDGKPYLVYCYEWLQNGNGTIESIALKPDFSGTTGSSNVLFRAKDAPWNRQKNNDGSIGPNKVTDGPYVFKTGSGRLGMIWTSWIDDVYTQGVAYSSSNKLEGPWIHEPAPITPPNFGHGMLFYDFSGKLLMAVHSHKDVNGRYVRIPKLFEVDISGNKLYIGNQFHP
ncbi:MAG: glycoside hydrolase, partial [Sphingobacteriales bacterium]